MKHYKHPTTKLALDIFCMLKCPCKTTNHHSLTKVTPLSIFTWYDCKAPQVGIMHQNVFWGKSHDDWYLCGMRLWVVQGEVPATLTK